MFKVEHIKGYTDYIHTVYGIREITVGSEPKKAIQFLVFHKDEWKWLWAKDWKPVDQIQEVLLPLLEDKKKEECNNLKDVPKGVLLCESVNPDDEFNFKEDMSIEELQKEGFSAFLLSEIKPEGD